MHLQDNNNLIPLATYKVVWLHHDFHTLKWTIDQGSVSQVTEVTFFFLAASTFDYVDYSDFFNGVNPTRFPVSNVHLTTYICVLECTSLVQKQSMIYMTIQMSEF